MPAVTGLRASPKTFCVKKASRCRHPGTTLRFTLTAAAKVTIDANPRWANVGPVVLMKRRFPAGESSVHLAGKRLWPGRWKLLAQGMNSRGTGNVSETNVRVVKHR